MSKSPPLAVVILAAGRGSRMKSRTPKVLHEVGGAALIAHVIRTAESLKPQKIVIVLAPGMEEVADAVKPHVSVIQKKPLGTADAVKAALPALKNFKNGNILVLYGDVPLVKAETLKALVTARKKASMCFAAMMPDNAGSYGRMVLNKDSTLKKIVEAKDASKSEKEIALCNAGFVCADAAKLPGWISKIKNSNKQKEFYLTDLPEIAAAENAKTVIEVISEEEAQGVNDRIDLAMAEEMLQHRRRIQMLEAGVTLRDPHSVYFSWDTKIAADVEIEPGVVFGPGVSVAAGAVIRAFSHIEGAKIGPNVSVGPFARLRPGTIIEENAKIGNFVEVKKSTIGRGSKINHLAYVGDTMMGDDVNFSAGAITVNYDGFDKHKTKIGKGVMVGSNVNLIAPVTLHDGAYIAAGSTITEDAPANALILERSAAEIRKNWASDFRKKKGKRK